MRRTCLCFTSCAQRVASWRRVPAEGQAGRNNNNEQRDERTWIGTPTHARLREGLRNSAPLQEHAAASETVASAISTPRESAQCPTRNCTAKRGRRNGS